jgi:hypothetical protein
VEDHASFCQTLAVGFDGEPEFEVVAQADTAAGACEALDGLEGYRRESIRRSSRDDYTCRGHAQILAHGLRLVSSAKVRKEKTHDD